jgi:hypothetical protein
MKAGIVADSYQYSAMAAARLGLRLCALRKPRHAAIPGLRNIVAGLFTCSSFQPHFRF